MFKSKDERRDQKQKEKGHLKAVILVVVQKRVDYLHEKLLLNDRLKALVCYLKNTK